MLDRPAADRRPDGARRSAPGAWPAAPSAAPLRPGAVVGLAVLLALATLAEPRRDGAPTAAGDAAGEAAPWQDGLVAGEWVEPALTSAPLLVPTAGERAVDGTAGVGDPLPPPVRDDAVASGTATMPPAEEPPEPREAPALPPHQYMMVREDGRELRLPYRDVPPTGAVLGRAVLLLDAGEAGWERDSTAAVLAAAGYRVLVPDRAGGAAQDGRAVALSSEALAGHAALLLDSLGVPRVAVVVRDDGRELASRLSQRFPGLATRVVVVPAGVVGQGDVSALLLRSLAE